MQRVVGVEPHEQLQALVIGQAQGSIGGSRQTPLRRDRVVYIGKHTPDLGACRKRHAAGGVSPSAVAAPCVDFGGRHRRGKLLSRCDGSGGAVGGRAGRVVACDTGTGSPAAGCRWPKPYPALWAKMFATFDPKRRKIAVICRTTTRKDSAPPRISERYQCRQFFRYVTLTLCGRSRSACVIVHHLPFYAANRAQNALSARFVRGSFAGCIRQLPFLGRLP